MTFEEYMAQKQASQGLPSQGLPSQGLPSQGLPSQGLRPTFSQNIQPKPIDQLSDEIDPVYYEEGLKALQGRQLMTPWTDEDVANLGKKTVADREGSSSGFLRRVVADPLVSAAKSAVNLGEMGVGLADMATGGVVGNALEKYTGYNPEVTRNALNDLYSYQQQEANRKISRASQKGFIPTVKASVENPSTIVHSVIESSAPTAAAIATGGRILASPAGNVLVKTFGKSIAPIIAGAIGEGLTTSGSMAEQIREETGTLTPKQTAISTGAGLITSLISAVSGKVANKFGFNDIDTMFLSKIDPGVKKSILKRIANFAEGIATEGLLEEMPQSYQEQIAQNIATGKPWNEGAAGAAAQGALTGAAMGGGANLIAQPEVKATHVVNPKVNEAAQTQTTEPFTQNTLDKTPYVASVATVLPEVAQTAQADSTEPGAVTNTEDQTHPITSVAKQVLGVPEKITAKDLLVGDELKRADEQITPEAQTNTIASTESNAHADQKVSKGEEFNASEQMPQELNAGEVTLDNKVKSTTDEFANFDEKVKNDIYADIDKIDELRKEQQKAKSLEERNKIEDTIRKLQEDSFWKFRNELQRSASTQTSAADEFRNLEILSSKLENLKERSKMLTDKEALLNNQMRQKKLQETINSEQDRLAQAEQKLNLEGSNGPTEFNGAGVSTEPANVVKESSIPLTDKTSTQYLGLPEQLSTQISDTTVQPEATVQPGATVQPEATASVQIIAGGATGASPVQSLNTTEQFSAQNPDVANAISSEAINSTQPEAQGGMVNQKAIPTYASETNRAKIEATKANEGSAAVNTVTKEKTPSETVAEWVKDNFSTDNKITWKELFQKSNKAFGGNQSSGKYTPKDAYDAMELGVNQWIMKNPNNMYNPNKDQEDAKKTVTELAKKVTELLPTQTKRTAEQDEFQQFSTPPHEAFVAAWVANITPNDVVLEPSAGVGGLAVYAKNAGAKKVFVNELSPRRADLLETMGFDKVFRENAEQVNNILPSDVKPTVVLMNPPFSATSGRIIGRRNTINAAKHIEQVLDRLEDGGRLVAIVGEGMKENSPIFRDWWKKIKDEYSVRANIGVSGKEYAKYGTTFDQQFIVIDKVKPDAGLKTLTGKVNSVSELIPLLDEVRNERKSYESSEKGKSKRIESNVSQNAQASETIPGPGITSQPSTVRMGNGERKIERQGQTGASRMAPNASIPVGAKESNGNAGGQERRSTNRQPDESSKSGASDIGSTGQQISGEGTRLSTADSSEKLQVIAAEKEAAGETTDNNLYEEYRPEKITIKDSKKHPTPLVQSAAMAVISPPTPTYIPKLPNAAVKNGRISDIQLESVVYAGQAHNEILPDGVRKGFFIGDGTGVGKGREIAAIFWDNWLNGRKKGVWISEKESLFEDAKRDIAGVGWDPDNVFHHGKIKATNPISRENGILFTTYDTLKSASKKEGSKPRLDQITDWLGKDFDGVIVFDEAHNMGNAISISGIRGATKPSAKALKGIELQQRIPKARVVYVSATGATSVNNLAYCERLGLWGEGTPFPNKNEFIDQISMGGIATMEMISQNMKASGVYIARSLSYKGVSYDRIEHTLSPAQRQIYDKLTEAWRIIFNNFEKVLEITGANKNASAKSAALSQFWSAHQRFFNQIITSMQTPSVINKIHQDLKNNEAVVIQLVNTFEAAQERAIAKLSEEDSLYDLDLTPRDNIMQLIQNSFPTTEYEEYADSDGNIRTRQVVDSVGNPVQNARAVEMREKLLDELGSIKVPDSPIDMILREFGADNVAEITGRKRRVIEKQTPNGKEKVIESRSKNAITAEADDFMNGKRNILIFSQAGGTGRSYHADLNVKNQKKRNHYLLQAGWRADSAIQGLGRTHRSNQKQPPAYFLVTTDLKGQKRFLSSIARRLDQLGALTKGQRETGSQGIFQARDNLESEYAIDALKLLYDDIYEGKVEGFSVAEFEQQTGLKLTDNNGDKVAQQPKINQFLNRILSMSIDKQNQLFDAFSAKIDAVIEYHAKRGTLDLGLETLKAKTIRKIDDQIIYSDPKTDAKTRYVKLELEHEVDFLPFERVKDKQFVRNKKSGKLWADSTYSKTNTSTGEIETFHKLISPTRTKQEVFETNFKNENWETVSKKDAQIEWENTIKAAPKTYITEKHIVTGLLLPIWDRLTGQPRLIRVTTQDGEKMIGRLIPRDDLSNTLKKLGANQSNITATPAEIHKKILDSNYSVELANGWRIERHTVSGEHRIEIKGQLHAHKDILDKYGVFTERIQWETRYFIPADESGVQTLSKIISNSPVVDLIPPKGKHNQVSSDDIDFMIEPYKQSELSLNIGKPFRSYEGENYADFEVMPDGSVVIHDVWTDPKYRKQGIASKLVKDILDKHPGATVWTAAASPGMDKIAERNGFELYRAKRKDRSGTPKSVDYSNTNVWVRKGIGYNENDHVDFKILFPDTKNIQPQTGGMTAAEIRTGLKDAIDNLTFPVVVFDGLFDPKVANYQDAIAAEEAKGNKVKGFFHDGKAYINMSAVNDLKTASKVLLHEAIGHGGVEAFLGANFNPFLDMLNRHTKYSDAVAEVGNKHNFDMNTDIGRWKASAEWFAQQVENGTLEPSLWTRFLKMLKDVLRKIGFNVQIGNAELAEVVRGAVIASRKQDARASGIDESTKDIRFSLENDQKETLDASEGYIEWKKSKPDLNQADLLLSVPLYSFRKVKQLWEAFKAASESINDKSNFQRELMYSPDGIAYPKEMERFKRDNPEEYNNVFKKWIVDHDVNRIGYKVEFDKDTLKYNLVGPSGWQTGSFGTEEDAWKQAVEWEADAYLKQKGATQAGANALKMARTIGHNMFNMLFAEMNAVIKDAEKNGKPIPEIAYYNASGKRVKVDLKQALREMGDLRGTYFPRNRPAGKYVLRAIKEGEHPERHHFDLAIEIGDDKNWKSKIPLPINRKANELKAKGYKVTISKSETLPESVFVELSGHSVAVENLVNTALEQLSKKTVHDLQDIDIQSKWEGDDFIIYGGGLNAKEHPDVLEHLGGKYSYKTLPRSGYPQIVFKNADKATIENEVRNAILEYERVKLGTDLMTAESLVTTIADIYKSRGARSHMIKRLEGIGKDVWKGYEEDPIIAFTKAAQGIAGATAKGKLAKKLYQIATGRIQTWKEYQEQTGGTYKEYLAEIKERRLDPTKQQNAYNTLISYSKDLLRNNEQIDRVIGTMKGLAVLKYLAGRVSSPLVNLTAMATTVPAVMNGIGKIPLTSTARLLSRAMIDYKRYKFNDGKNIDNWSLKTLIHIDKNGWDNAQYNNEALGVLKGKLGQRYDKFMDLAMMGFSITEKINRAATILGTYQGIKERHKGAWTEKEHLDALEKAKEVSDKAHGVYGKINYPQWARGAGLGGNIAKSFYVFRTFSHNYLLALKELGFNKEYKALSYMLLSPAVIAGAGATVATPIIAGILKAMGYDDDPEEDFYAFVENLFGQSGEQYARTGLFGMGGKGVSLKGSLQIGILDLPTSIKDLLGAPGSVIQDIYYGMQNIGRGNVMKGMEQILPATAGNVIRGFREHTEGVTTHTNTPVFYGKDQLKLDTLEAALRILSFNPARVAAIRDEQRADDKTAQRFREMSSEIYSRAKKLFLKPINERSGEDMADIVVRMNQYNSAVSANPRYAFVPKMTWKIIMNNVKQAMKPTKREQERYKMLLK